MSFESRLFNYKQLLNEVENDHPYEHLHWRLEYQMKDADLGRSQGFGYNGDRCRRSRAEG